MIAASSCLPTLGWSIVLLTSVAAPQALILQAGALFFIHDPNLSTESQTELYKHFGTFTRSFLSVMELTIGNWAPPVHKWWDHIGEAHVPWLFAYALVLNFGLVKIISAVFLVQALNAAAADNELMVSKKAAEAGKLQRRLRNCFDRIAESNEGCVELEDFTAALRHDSKLALLLSSMDLEVNDAELLFYFLSGGGNTVTIEAFTRGIARLKGSARSIDLCALTYQVGFLQNLINDYITLVDQQKNAAAND